MLLEQSRVCEEREGCEESARRQKGGNLPTNARIQLQGLGTMFRIHAEGGGELYICTVSR